MVCKEENFQPRQRHFESGAFVSLGLMESQPTAISCRGTFRAHVRNHALQDYGKALSVRLNGGIGDHLEVLSQLLHWAREKNAYLIW